MCRFWAGGISSFPFSRAREYRLLRRLLLRSYQDIAISKSNLGHGQTSNFSCAEANSNLILLTVFK
jgi:hypothetical protein